MLNWGWNWMMMMEGFVNSFIGLVRARWRGVSRGSWVDYGYRDKAWRTTGVWRCHTYFLDCWFAATTMLDVGWSLWARESRACWWWSGGWKWNCTSWIWCTCWILLGMFSFLPWKPARFPSHPVFTGRGHSAVRSPCSHIRRCSWTSHSRRLRRPW